MRAIKKSDPKKKGRTGNRRKDTSIRGVEYEKQVMSKYNDAAEINDLLEDWMFKNKVQHKDLKKGSRMESLYVKKGKPNG